MSETASRPPRKTARGRQKKLPCLQSAKPSLWRRSKKPSPPASAAFGENYVQEGVDKIRYFAESPQGGELVWHFIGPLQSNKSRLVAEHFARCHTVDRLRIAQRLSDQRPADMPPLNVLIQINISDEQSKSGIALSELPALAEAIAALPNLTLRGLMAIPAPEADYQRQLAVFNQMNDAFRPASALSAGRYAVDGHDGRHGGGDRRWQHPGAHRHRNFGARDYSQA